MKRNNKKIIVIVCVLAVVLLIVIAGINLVPKKQTTGDISATLQSAEDGSYTGECKNGIVAVSVEVSVKDHAITGINILEHRNGKGESAEAIVNDVIQAQTLNVDTVSGATFSSYTILKAIENALSH